MSTVTPPAPTFAQALHASTADATTLALTVGVDDAEVQRWLDADQVPDDYAGVAAEILGVPGFADAPDDRSPSDTTDAAPPAKASTKPAARPKRKRSTSSKRRGGMTKAQADAVEACAKLAVMTDRERQVLSAVLDVEVDADDPVDALVSLTEKVLSPPKTLSGALTAIVQIRDETNAIRAAMMLGAVERTELKEMHRVVTACAGTTPDDLPNSQIDAAMVVQQAIAAAAGSDEETIAWLTELFG